jgi:hypothetical protein
MQNLPRKIPQKHNRNIEDFTYLIHHIQSTLFIIFAFLFIIFLINNEGLTNSKDLILFLLGGILGILNPLSSKE